MKVKGIILAIVFCIMAALVSAQPAFKGGRKSLTSFITNNQIYPEYSKMNCLQGTVEVSFKVNSKGRIFHSDIEQGFGTDLDNEALRIVRLTSGKWIVPSDHDTTVALILPINFSLREFNCEQISKDEISASIAAYKAREGLTQGILNFYDSPNSSKADPSKEKEIAELKSQLGYDEKFINATLKQAQQKIKQGDKQGACEDFNFVRKLGSNKADKFLQQHCK